MSKKTLFLAQCLITLMMAFSMSGIMGFIALGTAFLPVWPQSFIIAWPIAFVLTQIVTPVSFGLARLLLPGQSRPAA